MAIAQLKPHLVERPEPEIQFNCWAHIAAEEYRAYCKKASKYFDTRFKRWVCLLRFDVLDSNQQAIAEVCYFLNLGNDKNRPRAGMRSNIYREWCRAAGRRPTRQDRFSLRVFEKRMATVVIKDVKKNYLQESFSGDSCYSVVDHIKSWDTGASSEKEKGMGHQQTSKSTNQLSHNITVNDSNQIETSRGKSSDDLGKMATAYMRELKHKMDIARDIVSDQKLKRQFDAGAYELDRDGSE